MHEFFAQLDTFSQRYFRSLGIEEMRTPWGPESYNGGYPRGAIVHYTADADIERVVKWFMRTKYNAKAAANVVIADRKYPSTQEMLKGLPLVESLPVTVVQCRPPNRPTWHATWASYDTYGIEALNVGELRVGEGGFVSHWRRNHDPDEPEWTMPWSHPAKEAAKGWYRYWEPYTIAQIQTIITILRHLKAMYAELEPSWVLGHECVQSVHTTNVKTDKRDPGPLMPMRQIRKCVFENESAASSEDWAKSYEIHSDFCDLGRDLLVQGWSAIEAGMAEMPPADMAWLRLRTKVHALISDPDMAFGMVGKIALALLGYHIPTIVSDMNDADKAAVRIFQKMSGLKTDCIPGPATRAALEARLYDRGILIDVDA